MKHLLLGVAIATITTSVALAQPTRDPAAPLTEGPGRYLVFFPLSKATLSADDQQVISQAADEFRRTGSAQIHVSGHTDTTGSAAYNLRLSERRAQMVAAELEHDHLFVQPSHHAPHFTRVDIFYPKTNWQIHGAKVAPRARNPESRCQQFWAAIRHSERQIAIFAR